VVESWPVNRLRSSLVKSTLLLPVLCPLCLAGVVVAGTAAAEGLSTAQRVMTDLVMPVGLSWLVAFGITVDRLLRRRIASGGFFGLLFLLIGGLFSPVVADRMILATETPITKESPLGDDAAVYHAVVVLGGGAFRNSGGHAQMGISGERLALAAKMWHAGKAGRIICTGTAKPHSPPMFDFGPGLEGSAGFDDSDPAEVGREILVALGVPANRIIRSGGQNTTTEMQHLAAWLADPPETFLAPLSRGDASSDTDPETPPQAIRLGLITSAFHLPRAVRLAKARQLDFTPIAADSLVPLRNDRGIGIWVPTAAAGDHVARIAKEWLARVLGR
jgi:uncharacterized SAM-binding protein YcdF (DUF218 family)